MSSASSCQRSAVRLRGSSSGHHGVCISKGLCFTPSSNITSIRKTGSGRVRKEEIIIAHFPSSPCRSQSQWHGNKESCKQISPSLSKQSQMFKINMSPSLVNLSATLCLYSKAHSILVPANLSLPSSSALLQKTFVHLFWTADFWDQPSYPYFGKINMEWVP